MGFLICKYVLPKRMVKLKNSLVIPERVVALRIISQSKLVIVQ